MNNYKYLLKNIGLLALSQFSTKILIFLLVPLYTSVLSTSEYGSYDLFTTTINLLVPIATLNLSDAVLLFALDKNNSRSDVLSVGIKYASIGFLIAIAFLLINEKIDLFEPISDYWYYFPAMFLLTVTNNLFSGFARGIDKVKETAIGGVIGSSTMISLNLLFLLVLGWKLHGYFAANILAIFAQTLYLFVSCKLWDYIAFPINRKLEDKMRNYSVPLIANNVGWWINNSSDRYIVTWMCGLAENGIYSVGYKIPSILNMIQTIFSQAWTMSAVKEFDSKTRDFFFTNIYKIYNCGLVLSCSIIIMTSRLLAHLLYAKEFFTAWKYVPFLTMAIVFGSLSGLLGGVFAAAKDSKIYGKSTIIGAGINIVLNVVLVYRVGAIGAAIATLVAYLFIWLVRLKHVQTYAKLNINIKRDCISYLILFFQGTIMLISYGRTKTYLIEITLFVLIFILYYKDLKQMVDWLKNRICSGERV